MAPVVPFTTRKADPFATSKFPVAGLYDIDRILLSVPETPNAVPDSQPLTPNPESGVNDHWARAEPTPQDTAQTTNAIA